MPKNNSDKVPVQRLLVPNYILTTSKILTKISPFLASRFAAKLFLTPFRYKLPEREREMDEASAQKKVIVPAINREIVTYEYGSGEKKILMVHGWSGRGTQMSKIAERLVKDGFKIISFDAPAHGKASGKMSMMPFFIEAIHFLAEKYDGFYGIVAHSLGGMSSLKAISEGLSINKLVIIGTADSVTKITKDFADNMKMNHEVAEKMKNYLDEKFGQDMDDYSGAVSAEKVLVPTLVIHDLNDVDVEIESAYQIDRKLKNSELFITEGLGHRRILGNDAVINKISTFITAQSL